MTVTFFGQNKSATNFVAAHAHVPPYNKKVQLAMAAVLQARSADSDKSVWTRLPPALDLPHAFIATDQVQASDIFEVWQDCSWPGISHGILITHGSTQSGLFLC
jgi:hypothetical protein